MKGKSWIISLGLCLMIFALFFPPWFNRFDGNFVGFFFVFSNSDGPLRHAAIDYGRLVIIVGLVCLATAALGYAVLTRRILSRRNSQDDNERSVLIDRLRSQWSSLKERFLGIDLSKTFKIIVILVILSITLKACNHPIFSI
jgi:hypothetical protein